MNGTVLFPSLYISRICFMYFLTTSYTSRHFMYNDYNLYLGSFISFAPRVKNICCSNPQQSVLIGGDLENVYAEAIEKWLKVNSPVKFIHVVKAFNDGYGFVHFFSDQDAGCFFHAMQNKTFNGPEGRRIHFMPSKNFNGDPVVYPSFDQDYKPLLEDRSPLNATQYAIYKEENGDMFIIVINTPGITSKDQFQLSVSNDEKDLNIIGILPNFETNYNPMFNNRTTGCFNVFIQLPEKIDYDSLVETKIENGISIFKIKKCTKKRRFLNLL
ncbi:hypothetical protein C1645_462715 [Glomus cerebriforme]|uniref:SHSP domain-containing protein n=1 Tax=Glomus cerebriforme TaxID=658196 RepID=A0A397SHJ1_9GLOM|nr:hypothetical protein C1645_462715 [Glomus cerebriforme]